MADQIRIKLHAATPLDQRGDKEVVYDECISPLMADIIEVARAHGIPLVASFGLGGALHCSTVVTAPEMGPLLSVLGMMLHANDMLPGEPEPGEPESSELEPQ